MEQIKNKIGSRIKVVGNIAHYSESYTHGETGVIVDQVGDRLIVKLDNTKKYDKPYRYMLEEVSILT